MIIAYQRVIKANQVTIAKPVESKRKETKVIPGVKPYLRCIFRTYLRPATPFRKKYLPFLIAICKFTSYRSVGIVLWLRSIQNGLLGTDEKLRTVDLS